MDFSLNQVKVIDCTSERIFSMSYITVGEENSGNIDIYYEDFGSGQPFTVGLSQRGQMN
jgi:hypothetical protein